MNKKLMANKLNYQYLGKGFDDSGDDGFIIRAYGTTNKINIGNNMEQAREWLLYHLKLKETHEKNA